MNSRHIALLMALAAGILGLADCGLQHETLAGGTTTETEALIIGSLQKSDGSSAVGARVRIRPVGYLPSGPADSVRYGDITADSLGRILWKANDSGLFDLEANLGDTLGTLIRNISPGKESRNLAGILERAGSLRVHLLSPDTGKAYTLRLYGLERFATADSLGRFRLSLPAGQYRAVLSGGSAAVPLILDSIHVESGKETLVDSVSFPPSDSGLLGYWPFEEAAGEIVTDVSDHAYFGNMKGGQWVPGKIGSAIQFTAGQGYLDLGVPDPDVFAFKAEDDFTFAAWAKVGNTIPNRGVARRIISKQKTGAYAAFLRIFPDGQPGFAFNAPKPAAKASATLAASAIGVRDLKAPVNVGDGGWHHLAGTVHQGRLSVYVDGTLRASAMNDSLKTVNTYTDYNDHRAPLYPDTGLDGHLMIGCVESGIDGFDGSIDEVRIYDRALGQREILLLARPPSP
jgi:hypothetical protein